MADLATGAGAAPLDPDDIDRSSFIIYTSGTTGRAKGVLLSLRSMLWIAAACWSPIGELSEKDVVLSPLPLFHSYGLNLSVLSVLAIGASEHIMEKFSPQQALELLQSGKYTVFPGVPTMFHYLLHKAQESGVERLGNIRLCISAGAIMPATLNRAFEERFKTPLLDGYGITETATMVTMNWLRGERPIGSCGLPVPGLAVRIVDPSSREDVPFGEEGELIVRGPNLMQGYHNKPEETAAALAEGLVSHRRSREVGPVRLSDDHRTHQGTHHPRRPEHRAGRDRGSRSPASARDRLRGGRHQARHARRSAMPVRRGQARRAGSELVDGSLQGASVVLQDSRGHSLRCGNPAHRLGQDHALQAGRDVEPDFLDSDGPRTQGSKGLGIVGQPVVHVGGDDRLLATVADRPRRENRVRR